MRQKYLVLDVSYICHRIQHVAGNLSFEGNRTGVIFGFLRDLLLLRETHGTDNFAFCFDSRKSVRREAQPHYKIHRLKNYELASQEAKDEAQVMRDQITDLKTSILPELGYTNIFSQMGYEADDVIASVCANQDIEAIVVSADKDLYQLLDGDEDRVTIWKQAKKILYTEKAFNQDYYGLHPIRWAEVKAMAGCGSDGVIGIKGIGDKTAAKYIMGLLKKTTKAYNSIKENQELVISNLPLVELPYPGTKDFTPEPCGVSKIKWRRILEKYGIRTLWGKI